MTRSAQQATRHRRTRDDHANETAEDYVEAIDDLITERGQCRVRDLADRFGVSHVTVSKIVKRLQTERWVDTEPYRPIRLTARGRRLAQRSRDRHRTVYQFLLALGIEPAIAEVDSEGIEHHVSPPTLKAMARFVRQHGPASTSDR